MPKINFRHTTGFTLVEVLVSMIILAIGLLGLASLQGISLKNNQDAYLYSQANALAYEMSDLIKANRTYWTMTATYTPPLVTAAPAVGACPNTCYDAANICTTDQMAAHDYCYWQQKAISRLSAGAIVDIKTSTGSTNCPGTFPQLCLTLSWSRVNNKNLNATSSYQLEVTP